MLRCIPPPYPDPKKWTQIMQLQRVAGTQGSWMTSNFYEGDVKPVDSSLCSNYHNTAVLEQYSSHPEYSGDIDDKSNDEFPQFEMSEEWVCRLAKTTKRLQKSRYKAASKAKWSAMNSVKKDSRSGSSDHSKHIAAASGVGNKKRTRKGESTQAHKVKEEAPSRTLT